MGCAPHTRGSLATLTLALLVLLGLVSFAAADRPGSSASKPVGRLVQPRGHDGCVHRKGINRCATGRFVTSPEDVAVSPDGRFVYVASYGNHAIAIFARNPSTGMLRQLPGALGCMSPHPWQGCAVSRRMGGIHYLAFTHDGRFAYAAGEGSAALVVLRADA